MTAPAIDLDPAARLSALLGLSPRWANSLARGGVRELADMADWTVDDVRDLPWVGPVGAAAIVAALRGVGLVVGPSVSRWRS